MNTNTSKPLLHFEEKSKFMKSDRLKKNIFKLQSYDFKKIFYLKCFMEFSWLMSNKEQFKNFFGSYDNQFIIDF